MTTTRLSTLVARTLLEHAALTAPAPIKSLDVLVLCKDRATANRVHEQIGDECAAIARNLARCNSELSWWSLSEPGAFLRLNVTSPSVYALRGNKCDILFIQDDDDNDWREIRGSQYPIASLDEITRVLEDKGNTVIISREATDHGGPLLYNCICDGTGSDSHDESMHVEEVD